MIAVMSFAAARYLKLVYSDINTWSSMRLPPRTVTIWIDLIANPKQLFEGRKKMKNKNCQITQKSIDLNTYQLMTLFLSSWLFLLLLLYTTKHVSDLERKKNTSVLSNNVASHESCISVFGILRCHHRSLSSIVSCHSCGRLLHLVK